jgi:hypothetical protein
MKPQNFGIKHMIYSLLADSDSSGDVETEQRIQEIIC